MSQRLINRSLDLQRLRNEGYDIEIRADHLLVKDVPYVNERREVQRGILVSTLTLNGDVTQPPQDHVAYFNGDYPCNSDGSRIIKIQHQSNTQTLGPGVIVNHSFSSKPASFKYTDYYEKMVTYANILSHQARVIDPNATPKTFPLVKSDDEKLIFRYVDTASSRAGIAAITDKLTDHVVAIVGLGGTGAYILDLLVKTPVREIHLYDDDDFLQHNAFRTPGAASMDDLDKHQKKVAYFTNIYSRMRNGIIPHPYQIDMSNIDELGNAGFVFLCLDKGPIKKAIVERLHSLHVLFIDCGIDVYMAPDKLGGQVRVTTSTNSKNDHLMKRIMFKDTDNEYDRNIQIADLNALNAALAVIKWKKLCGFYYDFAQEHHTIYTIDGNVVINDESYEAPS